MDTIKFSNGKIITRNGLWSTCCCGEAPVADRYWEAIPCDLKRNIRGSACSEWEQCQQADRIYLAENTRCEGEAYKICECQSLRIGNFRYGTGNLYNGFIWLYAGTYIDDEDNEIYIPASAIITNDTVTFGVSGVGTRSYSLTGTLDALYNEMIINDPWTPYLDGFDTNTACSLTYYPARILQTGVFYPTGDCSFFKCAPFPFREPGMTFEWSGIISDFIPYDPDPEIFAGSIKDELTNTIGTGIDVVWNSGISSYNGEVPPKINLAHFDITFGGDLCGTEHPNLTVYSHSFRWEVAPASCEMRMLYGDYQPPDEFPFPLGGPCVFDYSYHITGSGTVCPYECMSFGDGGPLRPGSVRCCPQRGGELGPNQPISDTISPGYCWNGCDSESENSWSNLETTITYEGNCYHVSPYWYLFGKEGRFDEDYDFGRGLFINPDCDYTNGGCGSGLVPCSGHIELFVAQFHKDAAWGPFGSYYLGVDEILHKAWEPPYNSTLNPAGGQSFLSSGFLDRYGRDYVPQGFISTKGTWTETKEIFVRGCIKRPIPFYVGIEDWDDIDYYVSLDAATIGSGLTVGYSDSEGCGCFNLTFDTSGKTVGDFLDAINNLRAADIDCQIFAFCAGSTDARSLPASKIINTSAESYNKLVNGFGSGPDQSTNTDIGATIQHGVKYMDMFPESAYNISKLCNGQFVPIYPSYCTDYTGGGGAITPPICWGGQYQPPPKTSGNFQIYKSENMWWTSMMGCDTTIASIALTGTLPGYVTAVSGAFTDRRFDYAISGNNYFRSGYLSTNRNGTGYLVTQFITELQTIGITDPSGSDYFPFTANSGTLFNVWLDDSTRVSGVTPIYGAGPGTETAYNYSYREIPYNTAPTSLLGGNTLSVTAWVRRRCNWDEGTQDYQDEELPPVVPPSATKVFTNLDCGGDEDYDDAQLIGYGCSSNVCTEEFYIEAARCGCTTVSRCSEGSAVTVAHPYNTNDPNTASITQPTLYLCEYAIHPEYDFTMMVKVPFQLHLDGGAYLYQNGVFGNGVHSADFLQSFPGYSQFCTNTDPLLSNAYGWCQYIDHTLPKVLASEIPMTDPPTALIGRRTAGVFYSVNPWNFDPRYIYDLGADYTFNGAGGPFYFPPGCQLEADGPDCGLTPSADGCPDCFAWDRITNIKPMGPNGPIEAYSLTVLFRPAISDVVPGDVCPDGDANCPRLDINCGTACCECFFMPTTTSCCPTSLSAHPYTKTTTVDYNRTMDVMLACSLEDNCPFPIDVDYTGGTCSTACLGVNKCCVPICLLGGILTVTWNGAFTLTETNCAACDINGGSSYCIAADLSSPTSTCGDAFESTYCIDGCAVLADPEEQEYSDICFSCGSLSSVFDVPSPVDNYNIGSRFENCGNQFDYYDTHLVITSSQTTDCLGGSTANYNESYTQVYSGTSPIDAEDLGRYFPCDNFAGLHTDLVTQQTVSFTVGNAVYSACGGSEPAGATLQNIWSWRPDFLCGYPQVNVASGVESVSEGFFGIEGCFP